jgi:hypothetical protein
LTCCSVRGWSLNIAWTLYAWQMVLILNACNVQNKFWEFLSQMTLKQCLCLFIKFLFTSKVVKIIYIHPVFLKLCHIFEVLISYLYTTILSYSLVTKHEHTLSYFVTRTK